MFIDIDPTVAAGSHTLYLEELWFFKYIEEKDKPRLESL
jgi:hypothetical protein